MLGKKQKFIRYVAFFSPRIESALALTIWKTPKDINNKVGLHYKPLTKEENIKESFFKTELIIFQQIAVFFLGAISFTAALLD